MSRNFRVASVENVAEVVQEGETHLLRIVNIDKKRQRIGLSLKAVTAMEQIEWMAQREIEIAAAEAEEEAVAAAQAGADEVLGPRRSGRSLLQRKWKLPWKLKQ